jgi:hypothetical protein
LRRVERVISPTRRKCPARVLRVKTADDGCMT